MSPTGATDDVQESASGPAHGDTAFTVPLFDEFMWRTMPDWKPAAR